MNSYEDINLENLPTIPIKRIRGLYFLYRGSELVYIGMSGNIISRIDRHLVLKVKEFDSYKILEINGNIDLSKIEAKLIYKYKPIYNIQNLYSDSNKTLEQKLREELKNR